MVSVVCTTHQVLVILTDNLELHCCIDLADIIAVVLETGESISDDSPVGQAKLSVVALPHAIAKRSFIGCCCCQRSHGRGEIQRVDFVSSNIDILRNWEYIFSSAVSGKRPTDLCISQKKSMLVIVSPISGTGDAVHIYETSVLPVLEACRIGVTVHGKWL